MDLKKTQAATNTITYNRAEIEAPTGNIYEAITIIAKRANQINTEIRKELINKLDEFATYNDSLEEVFENKEQIEVSKYYERLPKPQALAIEEWQNGEIIYKK
ncbi:MAG TPA: DNA-directed RNA polymerase subunit omega [Flavobacterium sp.]|nr:DNA-directed RNA polymerase subunit omega [Flavobacterium sp.]